MSKTTYISQKTPLIIIVVIVVCILIALAVFVSFEIGRKYEHASTKTKISSLESQNTELLNTLDMYKSNNPISLHTESDLEILRGSRDVDILFPQVESTTYDKTTYFYKGDTFELVSFSVGEFGFDIQPLEYDQTNILDLSGEWLGVKDASSVISKLENQNEKKYTGNIRSNGIYINKNNIVTQKSYRFYQSGGAICLTYELVSNATTYSSRHYYEIYTCESILGEEYPYQEILENPSQWYANNPSEKFNELEQFIDTISLY